MSEGSRSWHERVSANTRDYFQGLIACQAQHKAGLREQHFCWSRRGWQRSRAGAPGRNQAWVFIWDSTRAPQGPATFWLRVTAVCPEPVSPLQRCACSACAVGHRSDFWAHLEAGGGRGASLRLRQAARVSFRFGSLHPRQHQGPPPV